MREYFNEDTGGVVHAFRWNGHNLMQNIRESDRPLFMYIHKSLRVQSAVGFDWALPGDTIIKISYGYLVVDTARFQRDWTPLLSPMEWKFKENKMLRIYGP